MHEPQKLKNSKLSDLIGRLNKLITQRTVDQVELARVRKEADALLDTPNRATGYMILGVISTFQFDPAALNRYFDAALRTASSDILFNIRANRALACRRIYMMKESADLFYELHAEYRDHLELLTDAIASCAAGLQFSRLAILNEHLAKLNQTSDQSTDNSRSRANQKSFVPLLNLLQQRNLTEEDLQTRLTVASNLLRACKLPYKATSINVLDSGEISYKFVLQTTLDRAAELSFEIALEMVDAFEDPLSDIITFSCMTDEH